MLRNQISLWATAGYDMENSVAKDSEEESRAKRIDARRASGTSP